MNKALMALIRCYQRYISPLLGSHCRFYPSCSHYALEAFERYGAIKGGGLSLWRLLRCNPWSRGGIDLVPENQPKTTPLKETINSTDNKN